MLATLLRPLCPQLVNTATYLPSIPSNPNNKFGSRSTHSMEGMKICSGGPNHGRANCISLIDGTWKLANVLNSNRFEFYIVNVEHSSMFTAISITRVMHSSWVSPSGRILMGSFFDHKSTEKLRDDGSGISDRSFDLQYNS